VGPKGPGLIKKYPAVAVFYEIRGPKGPEKGGRLCLEGFLKKTILNLNVGVLEKSGH
jgi:hypothetical protein